MSKAEQLGAGRFPSTGRSVSARRAAIAAATGVPTEGVAPPTKLPPHLISLNPDNPREALGDLTDLAGSLRDHGQKTAVTVMNRDTYLRAHPTKAAELENNTTHVVVDGSRRLAAAREAGLAEVKVMVDDEQGADENQLLESALVANVHREDMDPLDEARALKRLLDIHGSQRALAKRLHRSQGWVSQRLSLLGLTPELTEALEKGTESVDLLRAVGNKPKEKQKEALDELKRTQEAKRKKPVKNTATEQQARPASVQSGASKAASDYAVITPGATPDRPTHTTEQGGESPDQQIPEPRTESGNTQQPDDRTPEPLPTGKRFPYGDPGEVHLLLTHKMDHDLYLETLALMMGTAITRDPDRFNEALETVRAKHSS